MMDNKSKPLTQEQHHGILLSFCLSSVLLIASCALAWNTLTIQLVLRLSFALLTLFGFFASLTALTRSVGAAAIVLVGVLVFAPQIPFAGWFFGGLSLPGLWLMARGAIEEIRAMSLSKAIPIITVIVLGTAFYSDFQSGPQLAAGKYALDTFFHASITTMYRDHGVISVGLDGLVPLHYHALSHKIFAGVSAISGLAALDIYYCLYSLILPPLLIVSLATLTGRIAPASNLATSATAISLALLIIRKLSFCRHAALGDGCFVSESFCLSLILLTAAIIAWLDYFESRKIQPLVISCVLMVLTGLTKGSVGVIGFGIYGLGGLIKAKLSLRYWLAIGVAGFAMLLLVVKSASSTGAAQMQFLPLDFVVNYVKGPEYFPFKVIFYLVFHYLPVWVALVLGFYRDGHKYLLSSESLILLGLLLPGMAIGMSFAVQAGAGSYFSTIASIIALAFIAQHLAPYLATGSWKTALMLFVIAGLFSKSRMIEKSFLPESQGKMQKNSELADIVSQLRLWREELPKDCCVQISNLDRLSKIVGWHAGWLVTAVVERPMRGGVPAPDTVPDSKHLAYGLADYNNSVSQEAAGRRQLVNLSFAE